MTSKENLKKVRTVIKHSKIKTLVRRKNPPTQKSIAKSLNIIIATINKITNRDLHFIKVKKLNVHQFVPRHLAQRRTFYKKLCMKTI